MRVRWDRPYIGVGIKAAGAPPPVGAGVPGPVLLVKRPPLPPGAAYFGAQLLRGARPVGAPPVVPVLAHPSIRPVQLPSSRARPGGSVWAPHGLPPVAPTPTVRAGSITLVTSLEVFRRVRGLQQPQLLRTLPFDPRPAVEIPAEGESTWAYLDPSAELLEYADPGAATMLYANPGAELLEYADPDPAELAYDEDA